MSRPDEDAVDFVILRGRCVFDSNLHADDYRRSVPPACWSEDSEHSARYLLLTAAVFLIGGFVSAFAPHP